MEPAVRFAVNLFQITDLLDLKKLCEKVVDFPERKVVPFGTFGLKCGTFMLTTRENSLLLFHKISSLS
jgi:hypothetical protein